jgi:hypothetical protein
VQKAKEKLRKAQMEENEARPNRSRGFKARLFYPFDLQWKRAPFPVSLKVKRKLSLPN